MANTLDALYPGRVTPGDANYPGGSIKNETTPGTSNDGTPLDKEWANDGEGYRQGLLLEAGITPSETTDTATASQIKDAAKVVHGGAGLYQADINYSAAKNHYTKGNDGILHLCKIDNGPDTAVVDPVGDTTGTWLKLPTVDAYDILLPLGNYTSGTYTLPNSTTWSDYSSVRVVQRVSNTDVFTSADITSEILALGAWGVRADVDQADFAEVTRASSTEFSVTRGGNDEIAMVLGWRK